MHRTYVNGIAGVLAVGLLAGLALAQGSEDPVKVQIKAGEKKGTTEEIVITVEVAKKWHIYANPVDNEDLTAAQTIVKVESKGKVNAEVKYPKGNVHKDKIIGNYNVYEGKVTIPILVQRSPGDPLEVSIRYQACDDKHCLQPQTVKQTVR